MGQTKDSGYMPVDVLTPYQKTMLDQMLGQQSSNLQQAASGYGQFLPGGTGGDSIYNQAMQRYKEQTIPAIMNAFGSDSKGSSALNKSLAASASNLNSDIASLLSQMQLQAAGGMSNLGLGQAQLGGREQFALTPKQMPFWQQLLLSGANSASQTAKSGMGMAGKF